MPRKSVKSANAKDNAGKDKKYVTPRISKDLMQFCDSNEITLKTGCYAKEGDVVICSDDGADFVKPCVIGRVIFRCPAGSHQVLKGKKGKSHPDGDRGQIFVLDWRKQKKPRKRDMPSTYHLYVITILDLCTCIKVQDSDYVRVFFCIC